MKTEPVGSPETGARSQAWESRGVSGDQMVHGANERPIPNELLDQPEFAVPPALAAELDEIITHYPKKRSASLMLLHEIQEHFGYISRQGVEWIAARLELQPINIYELVTFYPMFQQKPVGKYHLRICRTLSCALAGSYELHEELCRKLGLNMNSHLPQSTDDGKYTLEFVECLAACASAPAVMCNGEFYESVSREKGQEILRSCK